MDKVSVVTVCFNAGKVLENTILSIIRQSYANLEYVVVDGGSTDGSVDIIRNYEDKITTWISEPDEGIYDAMNKGLQKATGDWIIFMNAGDGFANERVLENFIPQILADTTIAYGDAIMVCDGYYYVSRMGQAEVVVDRMPVNHQATLIRRSYHQQNPYDTTFKSSGDYNFFYQAYFRDRVIFQYIPQLVCWFDNKEGMSKDNHVTSLHENLRIWKKENDWLFRARQELSLVRYRVVMFIKTYFLSRSMRISHEMKRLSREGYQIEIGSYKNPILNL